MTALQKLRPFGPLVLVAGAVLILAAALPAATAPDSEVDRFLLELKVRTALLEKMGLPAADISAKATLGEVWLLGTVKKDADSGTAEDITKTVEGVKGVHNDIKVVDASQKGESGATRVAQKAERGIDDGLLELRLKSKLIAELGRSAFHIE